MKKTISLALLACAFVFATNPLGAEQPQNGKSKLAKSAATSDSPVVARVNGQPITEADLELFSKMLKLTAADAVQKREQMIEQLIDRQLLRAFLAQKKVAADPARLDLYFTQVKTRLKNQDADFDKLLAKSGLAEETWRRELKLPSDWDEYVRRQTTDEKLREIWKYRRHEFDGSEVRAAHIVLKSDNPAADETKLANLRRQILAKEITFADAAKKHSQSPAAEKGGDLGRFGYRGKLGPPYPQAAFALKVGEISEPFRSQYGVHLLTVTERSEGQLSLEDARPEILQVLSAEMQRDVLQQERAKAKIERP
jgi:peptidyl-prolyl cis-trans isomerase C